ncbi:MAG: L-serine ammonia-lyase, iron-sulfur-dependent, subunit alpha [Verrucomicrobiae bacterium]
MQEEATLDYENAGQMLCLAQSHGWPLWKLSLAREARLQNCDEAQLLERMGGQYRIMRKSVRDGIQIRELSASRLSGGDARHLWDYSASDGPLFGPRFAKLAAYGFAVLEHNAQFGRIVATPTAGSSGILSACLLDLEENEGLDEMGAARALFTAAAIGVVIGKNASFSGARGGCQAEVGSASCMAAAAVTEARGGSPELACSAAAFALMNTLGMVCDPIGGYVEVPCVSRNGMFAVHSMLAAMMALAGVRCVVPLDDVVIAMRDIGRRMPRALKETSEGGLALTPTAKNLPPSEPFPNTSGSSAASGGRLFS